MKKQIYFLTAVSLFTLNCFSQNIGISATGVTPAPSAMLDVVSANKGLLIPRVALTSTTDVTTIPSPVTSLLVYNTATAGTPPTNVMPGYYFWNATYWAPFSTSVATNPVVGTLTFPAGTAAALYTPYANLDKGVYLCYLYICGSITGSANYYFRLGPESSTPANIVSGSNGSCLSSDFSALKNFTNIPFVLYVRANGTPVRFAAKHDNGGTLTISSVCPSVTYFKISE